MENDYTPELNIEKQDHQNSQEKQELERSILEKARENQDLRQDAKNITELNENREKSIEDKSKENLQLRGDDFNDFKPLTDHVDKNMKGDIGENIAEKALEKEYGIDFSQMQDRPEGWMGRFSDQMAQDGEGNLIIAEVKYWNDSDRAAQTAYGQLENTYNNLQDDVKEIVYAYIDHAENVHLYKFSPEEFSKFEDAKDFSNYIKNHQADKIYRH